MNRRSIRIAGFFAVFVFALAAVLATPPASHAQKPASIPAGQAATPAQPAKTLPPAPAQTVQVQGYTLSPAQAAQAIAYARARHELYFLDVIYGLLLLVLLLQLRIAPRFRDLAARAGDNSFVQTIIVAPLILLTIDILSLPTALWSHWLALKYQQSIQGWASWLVDWTKGEGVEVMIGVLVIWILYAVIRKSPRRWWLYFWLVAVPLIILGAVAEPLIVEPLFFKFTPLANSQPHLAERIERVAGRAGLEISQSRMFVMNASSKLKAVNAYVSGLGATKRVVVWDTSIQRMTEDEILFVFSHEMGHYVLDHVRDGILFSCGVLLFFLFLAYRSVHWMLARWGESWAIRGADDLASLPALILLLTVFGFLFTPISNAYSRHLEHQADQYGLEAIHGLVPGAPVVAAHAFQILGEVDLEEPNPSTAVKFWFYNHPPLDERMRFAQTYDPWSEGRAPEFVK
ncbi:MAG: M48 family metallopeptidase [Acidobacteriia bacterium]|nr:M48 family metallopeptidase [Terriglobia bacterium]